MKLLIILQLLTLLAVLSGVKVKYQAPKWLIRLVNPIRVFCFGPAPKQRKR